MSDDEHHEHFFEAAGTGASLTFPMAAGSLRKNGHVILNGRPCKIVEHQKPPQTGIVHVVGLDIFTAKRLMATFNVDDSADVPNVSRNEYQLVNIDDGFLNLMTQDGTPKDDVKVPDSDLGQSIMGDFEDGKDILVTIVSAMNEEDAISYKCA